MPPVCTRSGSHLDTSHFQIQSLAMARRIVQVHAVSLKPIDKQLANGSHYASPHEFPVVCG